MKKYLPIIKEAPLLRTIPENEIIEFLSARRFKIAQYEKNQVIHFDGDHCERLEVVLSGKIIIDRIDQGGNLLTITEFQFGDILGGNLIFSSKPYYPMTITSQQPAVLLEIEKSILTELCFSNHAFLESFLAFISDYTLLLGFKIKHFINRSIRESVIHFLRQEYIKQGTCHIHLALTKKALAEKIGVQRTSLSRELQKMKNEGLITFDFQSITILDKSINQ